MPGLDTFGDFFIAAQALSVRGDHNDSDTDGKICSAFTFGGNSGEKLVQELS